MTQPVTDQFARLQLDDWKQFDSADIQLHPHLTVLTGANATGKTTLLGLLGGQFGWARTYLRLPSGGRKERYLDRLERRRNHESAANGQAKIGTLSYTSGIEAEILVPEATDLDNTMQYGVTISPQPLVAGLFIGSHRQVGNYQQVSSLPLGTLTAPQILGNFTQELRLRSQGQIVAWNNGQQKTPLLWMKEALIGCATFGPKSEFSDGDFDALAIWTGFQTVLRSLLPEQLGFRSLRTAKSELLVVTSSGAWPIDEASGGTAAIIELAWQIFLESKIFSQFVVIIDEPENHLHPSLQRSLIPNLIETFPDVQFIVATHSPFVVTAVAESFVYVLRALPNGRVQTTLLDQANKAADADETLRSVLGLESTLPLWAKRKFDELVSERVKWPISSEVVASLQEALATSGLSAEFPHALAALAAMREPK